MKPKPRATLTFLTTAIVLAAINANLGMAGEQSEASTQQAKKLYLTAKISKAGDNLPATGKWLKRPP